VTDTLRSGAVVWARVRLAKAGFGEIVHGLEWLSAVRLASEWFGSVRFGTGLLAGLLRRVPVGRGRAWGGR
jgi:hypothetical protein